VSHAENAPLSSLSLYNRFQLASFEHLDHQLLMDGLRVFGWCVNVKDIDLRKR
jgi:hypothetical protein